ncbi:MAG TPA: S-adenosylmethionine:tRNA ribosyltransferase-isomerase, partial [Acidimicrobiales bacterium]|nr:S-adenosylmethionine:tRNA ribosyltransferase-isomerase [Acidimicrobiales bacterium]
MTAVVSDAGRALVGLPTFDLPPELEASVPPEARGITRDAVRMMVAYRGSGELVHTTFGELPGLLAEGDLVVVNTSGTLAAEVSGSDRRGHPVDVHLSNQLPAGLWTVELRRGGAAALAETAGEVVALDGDGRVTLLAPYAPHGSGVRLWVARLETPAPLLTYLAVHGRPIRYGYVRGSWPITAYQNVYVTEPGSAEMPSAGRPFTPEVITRLVARGVGVTPIVLHTGVASLEASE